MKYRIVTDKYSGYEVQVKVWWFPFYFMVGYNTHSSVENAEAFVIQDRIKRSFKRKVVKYIN